MDILVCENITGPAMEDLRRRFEVEFVPELWRDPKALATRVGTARGLIVRNQTQVSAELIASASKLEIIGRAGAGLDNVDTEAARRAGVVVTYAPNENSVSVAELTIGLMLALARNIPAADRDTRGGGWNRQAFMGNELYGKILGVVGLGRIGRLVAQRAIAFGMRVIAHDDYVDATSDDFRRLDVQLVPLDDLLNRSDVVTCHVPLNDETRGLFNAERFGRMKPTARFINTSRGEVVDEEALIESLQRGRIGGAALDVRRIEPPGTSRLNELDNVILTPHIAAFTHEAQHRVVAAVCADVAAVLSGEAAANAFGPAVPRRNSPS